jgi:hypothetical protein
MFNLLAPLFFSIGFLVSVAAVTYFGLHLIEKVVESRARKQAHEKRLVTLLDSINQKLNAKP